MRLGLSSAAFYGDGETEDQAFRVMDYPVDGVEVFLQTHQEYTAEFGHHVGDILGGMMVLSVHPKGTQFEPELFGRSRRQVEDAFRAFSGVCDAGQALGARYYVFHGPGGGAMTIHPRYLYDLPERFARMQSIARERGMEVLWENVSWCALRLPEDVEEVKALIPNIRFTLDIKQAFRAGLPWETMMDAMGKEIAHVHLLDIRPDGGVCLPGEGTVDFGKLFRRLNKLQYQGDVILEPYATETRNPEALVRSIAYLRQEMGREG